MKLFKKIVLIVLIILSFIGFWGGMVYHPKITLVISGIFILYNIILNLIWVIKNK